MPVPSDVWKVTKIVVELADDLQNYHAELKELRQELRDLTLVVRGLALKIEHSDERADGASKRLLLELENSLLKFERRLPPAVAARGEENIES